jgi:hypothetical protein
MDSESSEGRSGRDKSHPNKQKGGNGSGGLLKDEAVGLPSVSATRSASDLDFPLSKDCLGLSPLGSSKHMIYNVSINISTTMSMRMPYIAAMNALVKPLNGMKVMYREGKVLRYGETFANRGWHRFSANDIIKSFRLHHICTRCKYDSHARIVTVADKSPAWEGLELPIQMVLVE